MFGSRLGCFSTLLIFIKYTNGDNFPSLISENATMAIILDRQFLEGAYDDMLKVVKKLVADILREESKYGGLNVQYYSWTNINLKRGLTAVFVVASCSDTWQLYEAAQSEDLLVLSLTDPTCPRLPESKAFLVPLVISGEEMPQLLMDLRISGAFRWKSAILLHDDILGRDMIARVVTSLSSAVPNASVSSISLSLYKIQNEESTWQQKRNIKNILTNLPINFIGSNFIVMVKRVLIEYVMEIATSSGIVNPRSQWLYVIADTNATNGNISDHTRMMGEGDNVAFLYNLTTKGSTCTSGMTCHIEEMLKGFVYALDLCISEEKRLIQQVSDEEWEAIRPTKAERQQSLIQHMKTHLSKNSACANCTLWRLQAGETWGTNVQASDSDIGMRDMDLLQVGYWRPGEGPILTDFMFPHVAHGFRGRQLSLVTIHNPPWQIVTLNSSGSPMEFGGLVFDIIKQLSMNMNFTYTVLFLKNNDEFTNDTSHLQDLVTDHKLPTNVIPESIIQIVKKRKVILAAVAFTINDEHTRAFDVNFTIPISIQPYTFLVSRPKELSRALLFMSPFTYDTWLCLAGAVAVMGPVLYLVHRFSPYYDYRGTRSSGGLSSLPNCLWYMYGALLQQGGTNLPQADSGRLVIGTWWLVVVVVVTTYCGNLVAFLTFPKIDTPITTVEQLLSHRDTVSWGVRSGSYLQQHLQKSGSDQPKLLALHNGAMSHDEEDPNMIDRVRKGKHVYIEWKTNLQFIMKNEFLITERCDFALGTDEFLEEKIGLIMAKTSPYLSLVNDEIKRMHQAGLIQKWLAEYLPKKDRCWNAGKTADINNHTVNIDDMQGSFFVLILGFLFAVCVILLECLYKRHKSSREKEVIKPFVM